MENTIKTIKEHGKEKTINYRYNVDDAYKRQIEYFFEQYDKKNLDIMNNFSEALKIYKKIVRFKKEHCLI